MRGVPWEPIPGMGDREVKSTVHVKMLEAPILKMPQARTDIVEARRTRITKRDVERFGMTPGCQRCKSVLLGGVRREHTEECRKKDGRCNHSVRE